LADSGGGELSSGGNPLICNMFCNELKEVEDLGGLSEKFEFSELLSLWIVGWSAGRK
jgi:hypothetical protein